MERSESQHVRSASERWVSLRFNPAYGAALASMLHAIEKLFRRKPPFETIFSAPGVGEKPGVQIHAMLYSRSAVARLVDALVTEFKAQRVKSPPDTKHLLIVVLGPCDGPRFISLWRSRILSDTQASAWMASMAVAELGCDDPLGNKQFHSLLDGTMRTNGQPA